MLFIAGMMEGKIVELPAKSVAACVSSILLWCNESPLRNSEFFIPNLIESELFFSVFIYLRLLFVCYLFGNKISYTFSKVCSLLTNRSNKLFLSWVVNSEYLTLSLAKLASFNKLSSNSYASSLFSSNRPIFFFPTISALSRLLMTFLRTSSTQSTNRFSKSPFSMLSLTCLPFSFLSSFLILSPRTLSSLTASLRFVSKAYT